MYAAFVKLLNMSAAASILIAAIVLLRLLLPKIPKKYICILWAFAALRLVCPFSISSAASAYNYIGNQTESTGQVEYIHYNGKSEKPQAEITVSSAVPPSELTPSEAPPKATDVYLPTVVGLWAAGVAVLLAYAAISYYRVWQQVQESILLEKNIFLCDHIPTPFILGVLRPKIYLPSHLDEAQQRSVIAHERAHLARLDHLWKPLGYTILCVHWFNPLVWLAYSLLCRDIEMACDEKVIAKMNPAQKREYSTVLLTCSIPRKTITACPLAFGEVSVKQRIRGILNYKKPSFWIVAASIVLCAVLAVGFLSNPLRTEDYLRFERAERGVFQSDSFQFQMQTGKNVHGPIIYAELWVNGDLMERKQCAISDSTKSLSVTMAAIEEGNTALFYQVLVDSNPYRADLNEIFSMPDNAYLLETCQWHGAKDIPLTPGKEVLLSAAIFGIGSRDFFLFEFDNENYEEAAARLQNQDCVVLVRAVFEEIVPSNPTYDAYWEALRQAGMIHTENEEELFFEPVSAETLGDVTQEELDRWNGITYQSAELLEDGSAVYKMNRVQYEQALTETAERLESICQNMPKSASFERELRSMTHNSDFTEFTVTLKNGTEIAFNADELDDYIRLFARRYSLYTTGSMERSINIRYQDAFGNPAQLPVPNYRLRIGSAGVQSITVYYNGSLYSYYNMFEMDYAVGSTKTLHWLNRAENLANVQILAKDANEQVLWRHSFTGNETFPWMENGWVIERNPAVQSSSLNMREILSDFLSPVRVEYQDYTVIDKISAGEQMTLEELLSADGWKEEPIPENVTGPGFVYRGFLIGAADGSTLVVRYDSDNFCVFDRNGNCIGCYKGVYTGEQMVDMLTNWASWASSVNSSGFVSDTRLTQTAPQDKFYLLMRPTTALNIDGMGALVPENQEEWISAWNTVLNNPDGSSREGSADSYYGIFLSYQDVNLELHRDESGFFLCRLGGDEVYSPQAAQPLLRLLEPILQEYRYRTVKPSELHNISSAALVLDGMQYSIMQGDPRLAQLEAILTAGTPTYMTRCWFTSLLTVTLSSGEVKTISVATDDCGVYLSDGVCYEFSGDNRELYSLFGIDWQA